MGLKNRQIALELGITPQAVGYCLNSDVGVEKTEELVAPGDEQAKDITSNIKEALPRAMEVLDGIISPTNQTASLSLQAKVAQDLLDRGGHGKITKVQGDFRHGYFGVQGLEEIKARAREIGLIKPKLIEGEVVDA